MFKNEVSEQSFGTKRGKKRFDPLPTSRVLHDEWDQVVGHDYSIYILSLIVKPVKYR